MFAHVNVEKIRLLHTTPFRKHEIESCIYVQVMPLNQCAVHPATDQPGFK